MIAPCCALKIIRNSIPESIKDWVEQSSQLRFSQRKCLWMRKIRSERLYCKGSNYVTWERPLHPGSTPALGYTPRNCREHPGRMTKSMKIWKLLPSPVHRLPALHFHRPHCCRHSWSFFFFVTFVCFSCPCSSCKNFCPPTATQKMIVSCCEPWEKVRISRESPLHSR